MGAGDLFGNGLVHNSIKLRLKFTRKTANFNACYKLILDQTLVTPASIARDPKLELIYSNFGPEAGER